MRDGHSPALIPELTVVVENLRRHTGPWSEGPRLWSRPLREAHEVLHAHGLVVFDWVHWREGFGMLAELTPERVATLDAETTLMLLTAAARSDQFSEGAWARLFESGRGLMLFERWLELAHPPSGRNPTADPGPHPPARR